MRACANCLGNSTIVYEDLDLSTLPRITLPNGETRVKRITFLAEVRNRALAPLNTSDVRFDRLRIRSRPRAFPSRRFRGRSGPRRGRAPGRPAGPRSAFPSEPAAVDGVPPRLPGPDRPSRPARLRGIEEHA